MKAPRRRSRFIGVGTCVGALATAVALASLVPAAPASAPRVTSKPAPPASSAATGSDVREPFPDPPDANPPNANPAVIGLSLSGIGTSLKPPTSPSYKPFSNNCHRLIDPGFSGKCVLVVARTGTVAGLVEEETAVLGQSRSAAGPHGNPVQERDLVWRRQGARWVLDLVHSFQNAGPPALVWQDDVERDHDPKLVFVLPSGRPGFGQELDLVDGSGDVALYRFLGQGFADVPAAGGLVTYVPGSSEHQGATTSYDQTLIGYAQGSWRVFAQQYVPPTDALRQHRGAFSDSQAVAAS